MIQIRFYRRLAGGLQQWSEWLGPFAGISFAESDELYCIEGRLLARWLVGKWQSAYGSDSGTQWDGWLVRSSRSLGQGLFN